MDCIIRFYDARQAELFGKKHDLIDELILSRSDPLIHVEFQFSERYVLVNGEVIDLSKCPTVKKFGISHSSTMQDGANGCRFKDIDYSIHPERWVSLTLPSTDEEEDRAWLRAKELDGKPYDLFGAIYDNPNEWCCTEDVEELIVAAKPDWVRLLDPEREDLFYPTNLYFEMIRLLGGRPANKD